MINCSKQIMFSPSTDRFLHYIAIYLYRWVLNVLMKMEAKIGAFFMVYFLINSDVEAST